MNFLGILANSNLPEAFEEAGQRWEELIYGFGIPALLLVLGTVFLVIGIWKASKIGLSDNEDSRKKAIKGMVWLVVGAVLMYITAFLIPILMTFVGGADLFPTPKG